MFGDCQIFHYSWGRSFVGKWFVALQCNTLITLLHGLSTNNDDLIVIGRSVDFWKRKEREKQ